MLRLLFLSLTCVSVFAQIPHHVFHPTQRLTDVSPAPARAVGSLYSQSVASANGLTEGDLAGLYVAKEYRTEHNGVTHLVYRQQFRGVDVYNVEWTVNIDSDGQVINAGGAMVSGPGPGIMAPGREKAGAARAAAVRAVRPKARAEDVGSSEGQAVWFAVNGKLRPAFLFVVPGDNGADNFATVVDSETQQVLRTDNLTWYQSGPQGLVFERESPQPNPKPGVQLTAPPAYVQRTVQSFAGDPVASPRGWVSLSRTIGNNVMVGDDILGTTFLQPVPMTMASNNDFSFPLQLGPGAPNPVEFRDAANTNLFYWSNRAHDLFYAIGFDEQAGNYQQDNMGRGGTGGDPMMAYSHYGSAANASAAMNNAFYTTMRAGDDGAKGSINMYVGGGGGVFADGAYDAQVILHEYTHGVSTRLVRQMNNYQGGSMGEAWSDFFSLEFLAPEGSPADGIYPEGEYLFQQFGVGIRTRPYTTRMDVNPLTYASLGHVSSGFDVHADGEIWVESLWDMRANLIQQFGEKEGRRRVRLLVIDGMKLSPPSPTMVDMRDAILLADRVDFQGGSQDQIWTAFAKRGLGALAFSATPDSLHIAASFDKPSPKGSMRFFESGYVMGETVRVVLQDANYNKPTANIQLTTGSGDVENLLLRRVGNVYYGEIPTYTYGQVRRFDSTLTVIPGDGISAYYVDFDTGKGASELISTSAPITPGYFQAFGTNGTYPSIAGEQALFSFAAGSRAYGFSASMTLPFAFPFFDKKYTTARVYSDGLIAFDMPILSPCKDTAALAKVNGIAPLWMDLAYGGTAQDKESIYMSTTSTSVTFRWAAETQPYLLSTYLKPEPVNFSVTLNSDGTIRSNYGSGNVNLVDSAMLAQAYGCAESGPTVGVSNGHETFASTAVYLNGNPAIGTISSWTFYPPFGFTSMPVAIVEKPAPNDTVQDVLTVSGIAYDSGTFINRLDILVDGVARGYTYQNTQRADFCNTQKVSGCPSVGFTANLNVGSLNLAAGAHQLQIRASNARGAFLDVPDQPIAFTVAPGQNRLPVGAIERPADGANLSGTATISGYAYAPDLRVTAIDVLIDGLTYGRTTYNQKRDDICGGLSPAPPNCPNAGFTFSLNTRSTSMMLPNGPHTLQVRALDETGRYTAIPGTPLNITVNNPATAAPKGVLTAPQPNDVVSGTIQISGYAWSPDSKVSSVSVLVDGSTAATLSYGQARPAECATLPDVAACPNIGFGGSLDTRRFSNGPHAFGISIRDSNGNSTVVPALIRNGMNIIVQN